MNYVIGVDGGGTKTLALLADAAGQVVASGVSGASNYNVVGFEKACAALEDAINLARENHPGEISALCLGLAGAGRQADIEKFHTWAVAKFPGTAVKVVNDAELLLAAGSPIGPVLALICGTGSIVYGRTATGELIRAGGWGYLFGDEGSGYAIGVAALRAVMQEYDGRGPLTLLTELVLRRRGLSSPAELVRNIYGAKSPRLEVASLSDLVELAASQMDRVALAILDEAARELSRTVAVVYPQLGTATAPLVISGGTILHGTYLQTAFHHACATLGLMFTMVRHVPQPAEGAVQLARTMLPG
ncbi:MAG: BadF/BadG/BcrA/BcrD ATPase family protein [Chloroflexota bacterium]